MPPIRTSGLAIASLVLGILAFFTLGVTGIVAVILGHMALSRIRRQPAELGGSGLAIAGLVTGYIGIVLLILMLLIPLFLGGAIFAMKGIGDQAKLQQVQSDFKSLDSALLMYKLNARNYPAQDQGLEALVGKPTTEPVPDRWVQISKKVPVDPWKSPYRYRFPGSVDPTKPEIISSGPDGVAGTGDDISSQKP